MEERLKNVFYISKHVKRQYMVNSVQLEMNGRDARRKRKNKTPKIKEEEKVKGNRRKGRKHIKIKEK